MEITTGEKNGSSWLTTSTWTSRTLAAFSGLHDMSYIVPTRVILPTFAKFYHIQTYAQNIINLPVVNA